MHAIITSSTPIPQAAARQELKKIDVLVVPTAAYNYTRAEIEEEETTPALTDMLAKLPSRNANLGRFTNFCNLLDMCGVSVYSGVMRFTQGMSKEGWLTDIHKWL